MTVRTTYTRLAVNDDEASDHATRRHTCDIVEVHETVIKVLLRRSKDIV